MIDVHLTWPLRSTPAMVDAAKAYAQQRVDFNVKRGAGQNAQNKAMGHDPERMRSFATSSLVAELMFADLVGLRVNVTFSKRPRRWWAQPDVGQFDISSVRIDLVSTYRAALCGQDVTLPDHAELEIEAVTRAPRLKQYGRRPRVLVVVDRELEIGRLVGWARTSDVLARPIRPVTVRRNGSQYHAHTIPWRHLEPFNLTAALAGRGVEHTAAHDHGDPWPGELDPHTGRMLETAGPQTGTTDAGTD